MAILTFDSLWIYKELCSIVLSSVGAFWTKPFISSSKCGSQIFSFLNWPSRVRSKLVGAGQPGGSLSRRLCPSKAVARQVGSE